MGCAPIMHIVAGDAMLFKSRRNEYADTDGPVRYLDDSGLRRPLDMPRPQIAIMFAFVLVAALSAATCCSTS